MTARPESASLGVGRASAMPDGVALAEANLVAMLDSYLALPGARRLDEEGVAGVVTDVPLSFFNIVAATRLPEERADDVVRRTLAAFAARRVPCRWWFKPTTRPQSLPAQLLAHGMHLHYEAPSMLAELDALEEREPPRGLTVEHVRDGATLERWALTLMTSFGRGGEDARRFAAAFLAIGLAEASPWQHVLGLLDGEPVGTASVFVGGGTVGVYHVGTLPAGRGHGVGTALTRAGLLLARSRGARSAVLQSSQSGYGVYQRLGFVEVARVRAYEKSPPV